MMRRAIAHHPPTDTQPVPERRIPAPPFPVPKLDGTSHGLEYTVVQFGSGALAVSPPNFFSPPAFSLAGDEKLKKCLILD